MSMLQALRLYTLYRQRFSPHISVWTSCSKAHLVHLHLPSLFQADSLRDEPHRRCRAVQSMRRSWYHLWIRPLDGTRCILIRKRRWLHGPETRPKKLWIIRGPKCPVHFTVTPWHETLYIFHSPIMPVMRSMIPKVCNGWADGAYPCPNILDVTTFCMVSTHPDPPSLAEFRDCFSLEGQL